MDAKQTVSTLRNFFDSGVTLDVGFRISQLKRLKNEIESNESEIFEALKADLGKSVGESYMCEVGFALSEIAFLIKNVKKFSSAQKVRTPMSQLGAKSFVLPSPYGVALIISPWNYPFMLSVLPLAEAIAAGNAALVKTSSSAPNVGAVLKNTIDLEGVALISESDGLLEQKYDYIFYTGGKKAGREIAEKAAATGTPVTLELGGKSPCIVLDDADVRLAAKRIVWGKFLNLGQTCVAPDYVLCQKKVVSQFVEEVKNQINDLFDDTLRDPNYGKIINERHFSRIVSLIDPEKVVAGGKFDIGALKIEPTVMTDVSLDDPVMQEEIFGPVLPVLSFDDISDAVATVRSLDVPLALYVFTSSKETARSLMNTLEFGGGCINDVIVHIANNYLPFGGFKDSGIGRYHGKYGFDTFSHYKGIMDRRRLDLKMRYYPDRYLDLIKKIMR